MGSIAYCNQCQQNSPFNGNKNRDRSNGNQVRFLKSEDSDDEDTVDWEDVNLVVVR